MEMKAHVKYSETVEVIKAAREQQVRAEWAKDWRCALVFEKFWKHEGLDEIFRSFQRDRKIAFDLERTAFSAVLQRIEKPGSDLACDNSHSALPGSTAPLRGFTRR
jgi:hypothetical protein